MLILCILICPVKVRLLSYKILSLDPLSVLLSKRMILAQKGVTVGTHLVKDDKQGL